MVKNSNPNLKFVVDGWKMGFLSPSGKFIYATAKPEGPDKDKKYTDTDTQNSAWTIWPVAADWTPGKKYTYIVDLAGWSSTDWGANTDDKGTYRTLSNAEHVYLINTRKFDSATGEGKSYQRVTLTGHGKGLLIYPDGFADQEANTKWIEIASIPAGCIFLPAAGASGLSTSIVCVGNEGYYWSSSPSTETAGRYIDFLDGNILVSYIGARHIRMSVRLFSEL